MLMKLTNFKKNLKKKKKNLFKMNLTKTENFLIKIAILSRFISFVSALLSDSIFEDYDLSTYLLLPKESRENNDFFFKMLKPFARWDSLYFSEIFQNGYRFDKNHVFFAFYPMLLKVLNEVSFGLIFSKKIVGMLFTALTLNLILSCLNAILFYR